MLLTYPYHGTKKQKLHEDVTELKTINFDTVLAQGYERLKVNIDQTWPQHSTKIALIQSQNTEQQMKYS